MTKEQLRLNAELLRVQAAKAEMLFLISDKMEEIKRLEDNIQKQEAAEEALQIKIRSI